MFLQNLRVKIEGILANGQEESALIYSCSQNLYILTLVTERLGYKCVRKEKLLGGATLEFVAKLYQILGQKN